MRDRSAFSTRLGRPWVAVTLFAALALCLAAWSMFAAGRPSMLEGSGLPDPTFVLQLTVPFAVVGLIVARRVPENQIGWLLLVGPLLAATGFLLIEIAVRDRIQSMAWVFYAGDVTFFTGIGLMASQFFIRFPTGRPTSRLWRAVAAGGLLGVVLNGVWLLSRQCVVDVLAWPSEDTPTPSCTEPLQDWFVRYRNPFGLDPSVSEAMGVVGAVGALLLLAALFLGVISLGFRYRASGAVERVQLRWLLTSVVVLAPAFLGLVVWEVATGSESVWFGQTLVGMALFAIPISIGIAITRYRLYDIDRLIKRTATYTIVGAVVAGCFALVMLLPAAAIGVSEEGPDSWLIAIATLVAFGLFDPVRRRAQRFVDRRFDRQRYDARLVLDGFGATLLNATETASIRREFGDAVDRMLRPSSVSIWLSDERS